MNRNKNIFKECDIRGIAGKEIDENDAYLIGRSFGTFLRKKDWKNCVVGRDGRLSSRDFSRRVVSGLRDSGIDVIDLGLMPTPALYFSVVKLAMAAGLMVTASHNPSEYNGFKFITAEGSFYGDDIQTLAALCQSKLFEDGRGSYRELNVSNLYINYLLDFLDLSKLNPLNVVWDPGNGATGVLLKDFVSFLPGRHKIICGKVDGTFPNHGPDPSIRENTLMLSNTVLAEKADLGIAFDGDGDRIAAVDGKGRMLFGDQLLVIFARDFLKEFPGEQVMSEVKASRFLYDEIFAMGGEPIMWKVGHTNQKAKMKQDSIGLAGETSGHMFFRENNGFDDGLFAAVKLLNILGRSHESLASMVDRFPSYIDSGEIRVDLPSEKRHGIICAIRKRLIEKEIEHNHIDGIRAATEEGFWMIRSSNTQPQLTLRCESRTEKGFRDTIAELKELLAHSGVEIDFHPIGDGLP